MAGRILSELKTQVAGLTLEPGSGGCFEVTANDQLIYSKLETGVFPEEDQIVSQLRTLA